MDKLIKINILNEDSLIEKYNNDKANKKLIEYIIKEAKYIRDYDKLDIVIYNECNTKLNIAEIIIQGLKEEYENISNEYHRTNIIQLALLILGLIFLFFSSLISESSIWKEVLLIIGWVPIWEMVDLELFKDYRGRRKKKIIAKLLSSDFIENKKN